MSNIRYQMEKLSFMIMPNPFNPANYDPNHKDYATHGAVWHTGVGAGLAAGGAHVLRGAGRGSTISDALKGVKGIGNKMSALAGTKYGRIGLGLAGLIAGGVGAAKGAIAMSKGSDKNA